MAAIFCCFSKVQEEHPRQSYGLLVLKIIRMKDKKFRTSGQVEDVFIIDLCAAVLCLLNLHLCLFIFQLTIIKTTLRLNGNSFSYFEWVK